MSCEKVAAEVQKSQFYVSFCQPTFISCEQVAFRGVSLAPPQPKERRCKEGEGESERERGIKRDKEGERKRGVKMGRCEDMTMICEDVQMKDKKVICADVKMRR